MRLTKVEDGKKTSFDDFSSVMDLRRKEADDFYQLVLPQHVTDDEKLVMRQGFAGMLWSKQYYYYDLEHWLARAGCSRWISKATRATRDGSTC